MKRVGLFISTFFLFLIGVLFIPSLRQSVFACGWNGTSCSGSCGANQVCVGGGGNCICQAVATPTPCSVFCGSWCTYSCSSKSCTGGTCNSAPPATPTPCSNYCGWWCTYGCNGNVDCNGGNCASAPTSTPACKANGTTCGVSSECCGGSCYRAMCQIAPTATPIPTKYTCDPITGTCSLTASGTTLDSCLSSCKKCSTTSCQPNGCCSGYTCNGYNGQCLKNGPTPTPQPCGGQSTNCSAMTCAVGQSCQNVGLNYCQCVGDAFTPTPTTARYYTCNKVTGTCYETASGAEQFTCANNCVKNTPTPIPPQPNGSACTANSECISNYCNPRANLCGTKPADTCGYYGGSCYPSSCNSYSNSLCAVSSGTCSTGNCCKPCPTNTPGPTSPPSNTTTTPNPVSGVDCGSTYANDTTACQGNDLYTCVYNNATSKVWQFTNNCLFSCSKTDPNAPKCTTIGTKAQCCTDPNVQFCGIDCTTSNCSKGQGYYGCADTKTLYDRGIWANVPPGATSYPYCINSDHCGCVTLWERCGGTALQSTCDAQSPGSVPKYNNCSANFCGAPCGPTPTPIGGVGGGTCNPSCNNPENVCFGVGFSDGCGGTCFGTKTCTGTLSARAVIVSPSDKSCTALVSSSQTADGTIIHLNGSDQTQTAGATLTWTNAPLGLHTMLTFPLQQYMIANTCVSQNGSSYVQSGSGTITDGGTLSFLVGMIPQAGWAQTVDGDAYAATNLVSSIPATAVNPYFSLKTAIGEAGIITYGSLYDFSLTSTNLGETQISQKGWFLQHRNTAVDFYDRFAGQMDVPGSATTITPEPSGQTKPTTCTNMPCVYYVNGDLTTATNTPWDIGSSEQIVLFVNGNVTINSPIRITPGIPPGTQGGFFALIANGNITVTSLVGGLATSTTPTLEGMYIASNASQNAQFSSDSSGNPGTERLIVKGSVIADDFLLTRDLGTTNDTLPAEQFIFNPQLLFTMPDVMKEIPYVWQEVAP